MFPSIDPIEAVTDLSRRASVVLYESHGWVEGRWALVLSLASRIVLILYILSLFSPVLAPRASWHLLMSSVLVFYAQVFPPSNPSCKAPKHCGCPFLPACAFAASPTLHSTSSAPGYRHHLLPFSWVFSFIHISSSVAPYHRMHAGPTLCLTWLCSSLAVSTTRNKIHIVFINYRIPSIQHFTWQKISTQIVNQFMDTLINALI